MSYLSFGFAAFVVLLGTLYFIAQKKSKGWSILLAGSLFFYCCFDVKYLPFLLFVALSTYFCALGMQKTKAKKALFALCILANAGVWFAVKLLPWAIVSGKELLNYLGIHTGSGTAFSIIFPIGISYFTLQAIAYLQDVYSGKIQPEKNLAKYLLFITYFPSIVQGPINRYNDLMPLLVNTKPYCFESMQKGLVLIMVGLVKKMVVADRLAILVNTCFNQYQELSSVILYIGAVCYSLQLYMDFSGCVDICRGVSTLFNVELINNFNRPYFATSIKDFWRKWHISLSSWLRDYIYIPLGGNKKGFIRKHFNLFVTFFVSGLWHGAGYNFIVWALLHAVYQILGQHTAGLRKKVKSLIGISLGSTSEKIYQTLITFNLVTFAWIFFRAPNIDAAMQYIGRMFSNPSFISFMDGSLFNLGVGQGHFLILLLHIAVFFTVELRTSSQESAIKSIVSQHVVIRWGIYLLLVFDVILCGVYGNGYNARSFLYGGF